MNKNRKPITYTMGQEILIRKHKLSSEPEGEIQKFFQIYKGPYAIKKIMSKNTLVV